jgi:hypothetical protein
MVKRAPLAELAEQAVALKRSHPHWGPANVRLELQEQLGLAVADLPSDARLATLYDNTPYGAEMLVERNNHGHAVILALRQIGASLLRGLDGEIGWATTGGSKHLMFDQAAKDIREGGLRLHDETTYYQLASIDGATLAAPPGQHDDRAMACVLALAALRTASGPGRGRSVLVPAVDVLKEIDEAPW